MYERAILDLANTGKKAEFYVYAASDAKTGRSGQGHAALHGVMIDSSEIDRGALAGFGAIYAIAAGLQAAHSKFYTAWKQFNFIAARNVAADQGPGDHRAETLY